MKDPIEFKIQTFFKKFPSGDRPFILGLSGGCDSMLLFHLMVKRKIFFHAVYIDHGWRKESQEEADVLKKLSLEKGIHFESFKIGHFDFSKGNIEDRLRLERLSILGEYAQSMNAPGIVLGHHRDDRIETVIKRLFEGARLTHLSGLQKVSQFKGVTIFRPLLDFEKKDLLNWHNTHKTAFFQDQTNDDVHFLRARMRMELIPFLEHSFKKGIKQPLDEMANRSLELKEYLDRKTDPFMKIKGGGDEIWVLCPDSFPNEALEMGHLLDRMAEKIDVALNRSQRNTLIRLAHSNTSGKKVIVGNSIWAYHKGAFHISKTMTLSMENFERNGA
ncbi:MAG: tRNA lysidine(34) synthetase TilS [Simkaniaceae bacterium]|nr:tRNA lysidine(34) synthetase TilS [Simkaniaceae bacterium]